VKNKGVAVSIWVAWEDNSGGKTHDNRPHGARKRTRLDLNEPEGSREKGARIKWAEKEVRRSPV